MSIYDDALPELHPGDITTILVDGFAFRIEATKHTGFNTGRRRYKVSCDTCDAIVHDQTTGPKQQAEYHIREMHRS